MMRKVPHFVGWVFSHSAAQCICASTLYLWMSGEGESGKPFSSGNGTHEWFGGAVRVQLVLLFQAAPDTHVLNHYPVNGEPSHHSSWRHVKM